MKLTAISLLLLLLPSVYALSFEFASPDSIKAYDNFSVSISASTSENYDVKIFVLNNVTNAIISEVYNDGWKNPYYYLKSAFPSQSSFLARATNTSSKAIICVRLRKTGGSSYTEDCKTIALSDSQTPEPVKKSSPPADDTANETAAPVSPEKTEDFIPSTKEVSPPESNQAQAVASGEVIRLNTESSKDVFVTSGQKTRLYAAYSFTAFVIFLVIFLIFKKL